MTVPNITLNNGVEIPQVGFGVFQVPTDETQRAVEQAFAAGYRHIDTAAAYGNEGGVGAAIAASGLAREEIFVVTKLRNGEQGFDAALAAFDNSRRELGLDVIDLYLIHWPFPHKDLYIQTWQALEKIYGRGDARAIGVSNFKAEHLARLLGVAEVTPAVNQIELHPFYQDAQSVKATKSHGIAVEAYSPLGQGRDLAAEPVVEAAQAHGVTPAQVVLRWHVQHGTIVIPKSVHPERMAANLDLFGFELSDDEMTAIDGLEAGERWTRDPNDMTWSQMPDDPRPW